MNIFKKKFLIFHPFLAPYRIDIYNRLALLFTLKVVCWYKNINPAEIGFDLNHVNSLAKFDYKYAEGGLNIKGRILNFSFAGIIKKFKPDVVLPHEFGFNSILVVLLAKIFKYKIYLTCDDSPVMARECSGLRLKLRSFCINNIDGLIAVNPETISILKEHYKDARCKYFYFPIIQSDAVLRQKLQDSLALSGQLLERYNLRDKKVVLFVGRLENEKGVDLLLQSYRKLADANAVLVVVGGGSLEQALKTQAEALNIKTVIFTGKLKGDGLYAWYNLAHIFVLPSRFEPFGAVVNEALIAGCRVVVSNVVGAACLVNNANGSIFTTEDTHGLTLSLKNELDATVLVENVMVKQNRMLINFEDYTKDLISFISN